MQKDLDEYFKQKQIEKMISRIMISNKSAFISTLEKMTFEELENKIPVKQKNKVDEFMQGIKAEYLQTIIELN